MRKRFIYEFNDSLCRVVICCSLIDSIFPFRYCFPNKAHHNANFNTNRYSFFTIKCDTTISLHFICVPISLSEVMPLDLYITFVFNTAIASPHCKGVCYKIEALLWLQKPHQVRKGGSCSLLTQNPDGKSVPVRH